MNIPKFHDLNNNPGLLPLKLSIAQNKVDQRSFLQVFDMTSILEGYENLQTRSSTLTETLETKNFTDNYKKELCNSYKLVDVLKQKVYSQLKQLNPLINKRKKRGLINGLGSIVKLITGNLDQDDAQRYD